MSVQQISFGSDCKCHIQNAVIREGLTGGAHGSNALGAPYF